jgi:hypothetical protein
VNSVREKEIPRYMVEQRVCCMGRPPSGFVQEVSSAAILFVAERWLPHVESRVHPVYRFYNKGYWAQGIDHVCFRRWHLTEARLLGG